MPSKGIIAIVDDEPDILGLVALHLKRTGFDVYTFTEVKPLFDFLNSTIPDLIILDLMLPGEDGIDICKNIKNIEEWSTIPIIMLTARVDESDKILGLEIGADDYVTKPFSPKELVARVKAVLRRYITIPNPCEKKRIINLGGILEIDPDKYEVKLKNKRIKLTTTEFKILFLLANKPGWVYSRDKILAHLWGNDKIVFDRTIDVHIKHLRKKLGDAGTYIKNIRGIGYKLEI